MPPHLAQTYKNEHSLYGPFMRVVTQSLHQDLHILPNSFVCEKTASQGKRKTGGRWTRPDVSLVSVSDYEFVPGKSLEIVTFELKHYSSFDVVGVFEAAAHSRFATRSYFAVYMPVDWPLQEQLDKVIDLLKSAAQR